MIVAALLLIEAQEAPIALICGGNGVHHGVAGGIGVVTDNRGNMATVNTQTMRDSYAEGETRIELTGAAGRIQVPETVMPRLHSGGHDGWWALSDIRYSSDEIVARFGLNFMNHPTVRINRISGHLSIQGRAGSFDADCEPYDPATVQRRF